MQGRYTHIVKDYTSNYVANGSYYASICSVGVMGTKYVRNGVVVALVTVVEGEQTTFDVSKIYSEITIGTVLAINLR